MKPDRFAAAPGPGGSDLIRHLEQTRARLVDAEARYHQCVGDVVRARIALIEAEVIGAEAVEQLRTELARLMPAYAAVADIDHEDARAQLTRLAGTVGNSLDSAIIATRRMIDLISPIEHDPEPIDEQ